VPSDFSIDFFRLREDENFNLEMRLRVAPLFEGRRVRPIHVLNGAFTDTVLDPQAPFIEWDRHVLPYFGDGRQPCDFTSVADTGRYVAAACADPDAPEVLRVAGDVLTMPEFAAAVSRATGTTITAERRGSVEDLARLIAERQQGAATPWDYLPLQYQHNMVSGRAKLQPLDNGRYPQVSPESVEAFARRVGLGGARGLSHSTS
jgi:nucleoside-diphosphate-sugar epimerase